MLIEVVDVCKKYTDKIHALEHVSLAVDKGEFISIVGPSGAGKSTLVRMLTAEEKPDSGKVLIAGRNIAQLKLHELPYFRRKVGVVFQDFKLLPQKTVYENVAFALEVCDAEPGEIKEKVPRILDLVGMFKRRDNLPNELSGGERQRVSIARALVHSPKILIADEPTGNLDPVNAWEIIDLLSRINSRGTVVILTTHNKAIVDRLNRRVVLLKNGKVLSDKVKGGYII